MSQHPFQRPWRRGSSTTDGEPIYDANGDLVMMVRSTSGDDEQLQKLIVEAVNAFIPVKQTAEIPYDWAEAIEQCKLAIIRHRADAWQMITKETVHRLLGELAAMVDRDI